MNGKAVDIPTIYTAYTCQEIHQILLPQSSSTWHHFQIPCSTLQQAALNRRNIDGMAVPATPHRSVWPRGAHKAVGKPFISMFT